MCPDDIHSLGLLELSGEEWAQPCAIAKGGRGETATGNFRTILEFSAGLFVARHQYVCITSATPRQQISFKSLFFYLFSKRELRRL